MVAFLEHPMAVPIIITCAIGVGAACLAIWGFAWNCKKEFAASEAWRLARETAKSVTGKVARFGTESADEYTVYYAFVLEGDTTVYRTTSGRLSSASHGALTKPGDLVTFKVLPGFRYVEDFYNTSAAKA